MKHTTQAFLQTLKQGDTGACINLYETYAGAIYGEILRKVQDELIAGELLKRTFICVFEKIESFEPDKLQLFSWMLQCANREITAYKTGNKEMVVYKPVSGAGYVFPALLLVRAL